MYKQIAENKKKTILLMVFFVLIMMVLGVAIAYLMDDKLVAIGVGVGAVLYALMQYFLANKILVVTTGARELERKENPRLYNIVENLAIVENLPLPKIYIIEDAAPNAFASGKDPKHAIVAVTTGLIDIMNDKELRAVMAHEMSHVKNYDIRISMIVFGLVSLIGVMSDLGVRMVWRSDKDDETKSPVGIVLAVVAIILMPLAASLARLAVSRQREYLADISATKMIGDPDDMIAALQKLQTHGRPMRRQNSAASQMFINNPVGGMFANMFSTHPSIESRIERLEKSKAVF